MAGPRIIIADTDLNYILPLQQKFVEEFFDRADLEIITDRKYFKTLFSVPQRAEILIVSEELYDLALQKHNIAHVFLLSEQEGKTGGAVRTQRSDRERSASDIMPELSADLTRRPDRRQSASEITSDLCADRIYKYTGIREIFLEITFRSADVLQTETDINKGARLVVVTSASGGVGKTTAAMGLAAVLSTNYKRVLYINTDPLQTFRYLLRNRTPVSGNDVYTELMHADDTVYGKIRHVIRKERFSYLPPLKAPLISLGIRGDVFVKIAESAKRTGDFDYILVDADCSFDENKVQLLGLADQVILVTGQNAASIEATNLLAEHINGIDRGKFIFIGNDFVREADSARITSQAPRKFEDCLITVGDESAGGAPQVLQKFEISEYVEHFEQYDQMRVTDFAEQMSLRRAAYLLV